MNNAFYLLSAKDIKGNIVPMEQYRGKVLIIVNIASKCGFKGQLTQLEELYQKYKNKGLEILAFPCNQFANQEPKNGAQIESFCELNYGVTFKVFDKIKVNGPETHPIYQFLKTNIGNAWGKSIKWNFTKFVINKSGEVVKREAPIVNPLKMESYLTDLL